MKLLLAFALIIAVAYADEVRVVPLPEAPAPDVRMPTAPSMGQVFVSGYVVEPVKVDVPIMRDAVDGLKVRIVDAPFSYAPDLVMVVQPELPAPESVNVIDINEEFQVPTPVKLGDAPEPAFETVDAVRIAEPAPVAEQFVPESVRIADVPLPAMETPVDTVRFADAPLDMPQPVRIAKPALPVVQTPEAIKIAVPEFRDYRVKVFDDPMMR